MNYMNLCEFLEDNKDGFSIDGKDYIDKGFQRIYQIYTCKRRTALLITNILTELNVHSADTRTGILIEIDFDTPALRKINVKKDKKTKKYSHAKNAKVSSFYDLRSLLGNRNVLIAMSGTFNDGVNSELFKLIDIDIVRLVVLNALRWSIKERSSGKFHHYDSSFKDMKYGEDIVSYVYRSDVHTLMGIIKYCFSILKRSSREMFEPMYKNLIFGSKKEVLDYESAIKIELSKIHKIKKEDEIDTDKSEFKLSLPVNHKLTPDDVNRISKSADKLSQCIDIEILSAIRKNLGNYKDYFIFVKMWKLIENTSDDNKERFSKFIEGLLNYCSMYNVNTTKLLSFIKLFNESSKKMEEFLDYLFDNKHLFEYIGGAHNYYKYNVVEYIDYYIHVASLRDNGVQCPFYPEDLRTSMDDAFALEVEKHYTNKDVKLKSFYENNDKVKCIFKKYPKSGSVAIKSTNYIIKLPMEGNDFVIEGATLKHCAAIYRDLVCKGKTLVLFLRYKNSTDVPLYTIEVNVNDNKLVQVAGEYNIELNPCSDEEACEALVKFCKEYDLDFSELKYFDKFLDKK